MGSSHHLNAVLLSSLAGVEMLHVPYKEGNQASLDLQNGRVNVDVTWMGLVAPARLPPDIAALLHREIVKAVAAPEIRNKYTPEGLEIRGTTPEEFARFVAAESERWGRVIRDNAVHVEYIANPVCSEEAEKHENRSTVCTYECRRFVFGRHRAALDTAHAGSRNRA